VEPQGFAFGQRGQEEGVVCDERVLFQKVKDRQ
jgi:hypothetical protein